MRQCVWCGNDIEEGEMVRLSGNDVMHRSCSNAYHEEYETYLDASEVSGESEYMYESLYDDYPENEF